MKYSPKIMNEQISNHSFSFKKKYGQNFIVDENIINGIVTKIDLDKNTLVIEVGPGSGSLTCKLAQNALGVLAYEIDSSLKSILNENVGQLSNVKVIFDDFLKSNVNNDIKDYNYDKLYFVSNLPYYITTPIIMKLIDDKVPVDKVVVMVQKEVGDRFSAKVGSRSYGSLTVFLNYYFDIYKLCDVSRNVFLPKPNVDSVVVCMDKKKNLNFLANEDLFFNIVRDSFVQKRKTIRNNLKNYNLEVVSDVLKKYGYDLTVRAEMLSLEVFVDIANSLAKTLN